MKEIHPHCENPITVNSKTDYSLTEIQQLQNKHIQNKEEQNKDIYVPTEKNKANEYNFMRTVENINNQHQILSKQGVQEFTDYWGEISQKTGNMRWQDQDFFDTVKRMRKWASNNYSGKAKKPKIGDRGSEWKNQVF